MLNKKLLLILCFASIIHISPGWAFDSGSTGEDGDFSPTSSISLPLPENGIFNFSALNIPSNVTVKFTPNPQNTPVIILVAGDATILGKIDISGIKGGSDDPVPPGAYKGGERTPFNSNGTNGSGPGGGKGGINIHGSLCGGTGAGYLNDAIKHINACLEAPVGLSYGSPTLQPLLGGSGGGGGYNGGTQGFGAEGGSGGGALLLAVTGKLNLTGQILSRGGKGNTVISNQYQANLTSPGGSGSGGGIRLVSTVFSGRGHINVSGGSKITQNNGSITYGTEGSPGRIRIETESYLFTGSMLPGEAFSYIESPTALFSANIPSIRITNIGGNNVPEFPTGENDMIFPSDTVNPVTIEVTTSQVTLGEIVTITLTPKIGNSVSVDSSPLTGTIDNATATATINLPTGASVMSATVTFLVTQAQSDALSRFAHGEQVKQLALTTIPGKETSLTLTTATGKSYTWPQNAILMN